MFSESEYMDKIVVLKIIESVWLLITLSLFKIPHFLGNFLLFNALFLFFSLKGLFTLVTYLLELWEFIGFVPTKQHSTVTVLQRLAGVPRQIKMFLNV